MGQLVHLVNKCPSLLLGAAVARLPRLRTKASQEAWLITRVRPAKGGGHPTVYGLRMSLRAPANSAAPGAGLGFADRDCAITGPLKGDWAVVAAPAVAGEAAAVRTPVGLALRPELLASALQQSTPFDKLQATLAARAALEHAQALKAVQAAAAAAEAAAAEAAAAAAAKAAEAKA